MPHFFKGPNSVLKAIGRKLKAEPDGDFSAECSLAQSVKYRLQQLESPVNAVNRGSFDDTLRARIRPPRSLAVQCFYAWRRQRCCITVSLCLWCCVQRRRGLVASKAHNYLDIIKHYPDVSKCSLYVFTIIPPRLSDPCNFITVLSNPGTGADDAFVLKRCV